jgi:acetoin utilization protein AcuB
MAMLVGDWMIANPITVTSDFTILEAQRLLRSHGFRRLPVVDKGVLVGMVTDRDLKDAAPSKATSLSVFELNYLLSKLVIREIMRAPVYTVSPDDPIEVAALMMEEHKISGLPVVDDGKVVGMITITDILQAFINILSLREGGRLPAKSSVSGTATAGS